MSPCSTIGSRTSFRPIDRSSSLVLDDSVLRAGDHRTFTRRRSFQSKRTVRNHEASVDPAGATALLTIGSQSRQIRIPLEFNKPAS